MSIKQSETSFGTDAYNALLGATTDVSKEVKVYRSSPNFTELGDALTDRTGTTPFRADADDTRIVRVYNLLGSIYAETFVWSVAVWTTPVLVGTGPDRAAPKILKNGSNWELYYINTDGSIYLSTSTDGVTWSTPAAFSTEVFEATSVQFITAATGDIPLVYVGVDTAGGSINIVGVDPTDSYDTGIYWPSDMYDLDAIDFKQKADDTTGTHDFTDTRHLLTLAARLPNSYTYKAYDGIPTKKSVAAGGILTIIVRPPLDGRPIQASHWYPVQIFDQWKVNQQTRLSCQVMATNSHFDTSNSRDTLFITAIGFDGDENIGMIYSYLNAFYYSSRDGKHWSQDKIVPVAPALTVSNPDFLRSAKIVRHSNHLYLLSPTATWHSLGCFEFGNTHPSLQLDLTPYILEYNSTAVEARQTSLTLDNRSNLLWGTMLGSPGALTLVTKFGVGTDMQQISIEEIDAISPSREQPKENISITARDRVGNLTDRVENANSIMWDNQLVALDTFTDIGGTANSGLSHTDTVKGTFGTANDSLVAKPKYQESIGFHTTGSGRVADGHCAAIFILPTPTSFGGTSVADSPTYGGVVLRAIDKDNFWSVTYNYWTGKIELSERKSGVNTVKYSITPTGSFTTRANAASSVGIRVEFKGAVIRIYESTVLYSAIGARYNPAYTYTIAPTSTDLLQGYVGVISCGYSDEDSGEIVEPEPLILIPDDVNIWGDEDTSYMPTRLLVVDEAFRFQRVSSLRTSPVPTYFDPPVGMFSSFGRCVSVAQHPWNGNRLILVGDYGVGYLDNIWVGTPTYGVFSGIVPTSGYTFGWVYDTGDTGSGPTNSHIMGSINVNGFFAWVEYPPTPAGLDYRIRRTTDNFATSSSTAITGVKMPDNNHSGIHYAGPGAITMGCFATRISNINIWFSPGANQVSSSTKVYRSSNGGASYSLLSDYAFPGGLDIGDGGVVVMPYSKVGGGRNTSYENLWTLMGFAYSGGFVGYTVGNGGVISNPAGEYKRGRVNVQYTQDANTMLLYGSFTEDGGTTWLPVQGPRALTGGQVQCQDGCPINPYFYSGGYGFTVSFTTNIRSGANWTFATDTSPHRVIRAMMDFTDLYPVGGVHP